MKAGKWSSCFKGHGGSWRLRLAEQNIRSTVPDNHHSYRDYSMKGKFTLSCVSHWYLGGFVPEAKLIS